MKISHKLKPHMGKAKFLLYNYSKLRFIFRVIAIYSITPLLAKIFIKVILTKQKIYRIYSILTLNKRFNYWQQNELGLVNSKKTNYRISIDQLDGFLLPKDIECIRSLHKTNTEVVLGEFDQDGDLYLNNNFALQKNLNSFYPRNRNRIYFVSYKGYAGVKKVFRFKKGFMNELEALNRISHVESNTPSVLDLDFKNLSITLSYIDGEILREKLAVQGALIRDRDVAGLDEYNNIGNEKKWLRRIEEGKKHLKKVLDEKKVEEIFDLLKAIHRSGTVTNDVKYGNIIIEKNTKKPFWLDFDTAHKISSIGLGASIICDQEVEHFNMHFDTNKLSYERIKKTLSEIEKVYAPVHLGLDLKVGNLLNVGSGYGRWHFLLKHYLPELKGKRVLDLGANNGYNDIQMLRIGASEIIGIEINEDNIKQGEFLKSAFEWLDNKKYNLKLIKQDMRMVPQLDLGKFDIVTAFCSIYYLSESDIKNLINFINSISDIIVLQCNEAKDINRSDLDTYRKASLDFNLDLLKNNGYEINVIIEPKYYSRPLIIGHKK